MEKLQEGDIFDLETGHVVYMQLPLHFIYGNREGVFDELASTEVKVGTPKSGMDTEWLTGEYVVTHTTHDGGSTGGGMSGHDSYPNGHHVFAEKLVEGPLNPTRVRLDFYQSGCFTAMNKGIKAKGRAQAHWSKT